MPTRTPAQYDWHKALFNDRRLTKNFTSPRRGTISHVTLHHMTIVAPASDPRSTVAVEGAYKTWMGGRAASANYGVSGDLVWQYVSDYDAPWSDANAASNHSTLSIEHANSTAGPKWQISDATMKTGARLVATLHLLYGLGRPSRKTVRMHRDYYATACPGPYMVDHLTAYIAQAARFYDELKADKPEPVVPVPPASTVKVVSASQNVAGYNQPGQPGVTKFKTHIPNIARAIITAGVDLFDVQELSNKLRPRQRPLMDARLKGKFIRSSGGSDGRYVYRSTALTKIASGHFTTRKSTWFRRDDKQAAWLAFEKNGARGMDVSFHLESEDGTVADAKRVAQALDFLAQTIAKAKVHRIPLENVLIVGDTNSVGMVAAAMKTAGWPAIANTKTTFRGWDGKDSKRYDYGFALAEVEASVKVVKSDDSDHDRIIITRNLTK